jgi:hypothetical protein
MQEEKEQQRERSNSADFLKAKEEGVCGYQ